MEIFLLDFHNGISFVSTHTSKHATLSSDYFFGALAMTDKSLPFATVVGKSFPSILDLLNINIFP